MIVGGAEMSIAPSVNGLNHVTLAVSDVARSVSFYRDVLGFSLRALWAEGAYLEAGTLWLCLSKDDEAQLAPRPDYMHVAFSVSPDDYDALKARILSAAALWRDNTSEGASTYFLDPDGHKLEIHLGSLETRLRHYAAHPEKGVRIIES